MLCGEKNFFGVVILSCNIGIRKPSPDILSEAVRLMGLLPEECVYVGDRPDWDVVAAKGAGFGSSIILRDENEPLPESLSMDQIPDYYIDNLKDLLTLFSRNKIFSGN